MQKLGMAGNWQLHHFQGDKKILEKQQKMQAHSTQKLQTTFAIA